MKKLLLLLIATLNYSFSSGERPNILWIYVEDLSPWMETYGYKINEGKTPTLKEMSDDGVLFSRCYVPAPVCSACRSALITGVYQTTTGTHHHRSARTLEAPIYLPEGIKTLPQLFKENGYATFNNGKDDYNFTYKRAEHYTIGNRIKKGAPEKKITTRGSGSWKDVPKGSPWFGQIQLSGGKSKTDKFKDKVSPSSVSLPPYFPNEKLYKEKWAHHYDTVRITDNSVKKIMDGLKKDGLLENTVVFFFSDHGNNYSLRHKQFCYEGGVHVPLIISGPGIGKNIVRKEMISGLDISATTLALAGIDLPEYLHGEDLFAQDFKARDHVVSARDRCDYTIDRIRTVRTDKYRYIKNFHTDRILLQPQYRDNKATTIRLHELHESGELGAIPEWAFFGERPAEELYDLENDPHQVNNLAEDQAYLAELEKHRDLLISWIKQTGDKGEKPESEEQLKATYMLWGKKCVNPEYDIFKNMVK